MMESKLLSCDREASGMIETIVRRARHSLTGDRLDGLSLSMDLTVCYNLGHVNLAVLSKLGEGDFAHDIVGIIRHLDRDTGELQDCFLPRCHDQVVPA